MIRVVLVDDEPVILRGLKKSIEAADADFKVVGTASNGDQGWKLVTDERPDLLFADISMPVCSGLEMIELIREEGLDTLTVILSGYSEFEKAQRAIRLGVAEYLVKPIDPRSFPSFLARMKERVLDSRDQALERIMREAIYTDQAALRQHTDLLSRKFFLAKLCFGAYRLQRRGGLDRVPSEDRMGMVSAVIGSLVRDGISSWVVRDALPNELLIIIDAGQNGIPRLYRQAFRSIGAHLGERMNCTISFSAVPTGLLGFQKGLTAIEQALFRRTLILRSSLICADEPESRQDTGSLQDPEPLERLAALPRTAGSQARIEIVRNILAGYRGKELPQREMVRIIGSIFTLIDEDRTDTDHGSLIDQVLSSAHTHEQLSEEIASLVVMFSKQAAAHGEQGSDAQVLAVRDYIERNFSKPLRIATLSDQFGFSASYLSILFKKVIGSSPNEYITECRMKHARWLLEVDPDLEIREVAAAAGYDDPYYFTRVFKTQNGCTPSEYKIQKHS